MKTSRALRHGGYATLVTAAALAIVVGLNLLLQQIPWRLDLTFERFFSLSEQSTRILDSLEGPVTFIQLWEAGRENQQVAELLRRYQARSTRIQLREVDPYRSPLELAKYRVNGDPPAVGSIILDAGPRFRILRVEDMYEMEPDSGTGEKVPTKFIAESAITNALASVTQAADPVVYLLRGHGEKDLPEALRGRLLGAYYDLKDLTLGTRLEVPDDAAMVLEVSPKQDLQPRETDALLSYLRDRGGKFFAMTDLGADPQPNLGRLLESFGVAVRPWLVVERAADHMLPNQPFVLIPGVAEHPITEPNKRSDFPILFPVSQVLLELPSIRRTVSVQPLLVTSDSAYAKVNLEDASGDRGPTDIDGPFILAAAITDSGEVGEKPSRLVVTASSHFVFPTESMGRLEENENLLLNSLGWLQDRPELISILPRTIAGSRYELNLPQSQFLLFGGIAVVGVPLVVFAAGLLTWLRRRHK